MWLDYKNLNLYDFQLNKTSYNALILSNPEFYDQSNTISNLYKKTSYQTRFSEICLVCNNDYFIKKEEDMIEFDLICNFGVYSLIFKEIESFYQLLGIIEIQNDEEEFDEKLSVKIPLTEIPQKIEKWIPFTTIDVTNQQNVLIPRKFTISEIKPKMWVTIGGLLNGKITNSIILIKLHKNIVLNVGAPKIEGFLPPRYAHAVVVLKSRIYVHGGENEKGLLDDFYILDIKKVDNTTELYYNRYCISISEVITGGLPSAIKNHHLAICGETLYSLCGLIESNPSVFIRAMSLDTYVWSPVEFAMSNHYKLNSKRYGNVLQFGHIILAPYNTGYDILMFNSRFKTCKIIGGQPKFIYSKFYGNYFLGYGNKKYSYQWNNNLLSLQKILGHDYYKIKPVPLLKHNICEFFGCLIDNKDLSDIEIIMSDGTVYANSLLLALRSTESKVLLSSLKGKYLKIKKKYSKGLVIEIVEYLYTNKFPSKAGIEDVEDFGNHYNMKGLVNLCTIAKGLNKIVNSSMDLLADIKILYKACVKNTKTKLKKYAESIDKDYLLLTQTDFVILTNDASLPCHKLFLYLYSGYFRNLLTISPETPSTTLETFSTDSIVSVIKYCYTIEEIPNDLLSEVLSLSQYLDIQTLFIYCQEKISLLVTRQNYLSLYEMAKKLQASYLIDYMEDFAKYIGFKCENPYLYDFEMMEHFNGINGSLRPYSKNKIKQYKKNLIIEGESPEDRESRLLQVFPLTNIFDEVPYGFRDAEVVEVNRNMILKFLAINRDVKVFKDLDKEVSEEEGQEDDKEDDFKPSFNRFQDLDDSN